MRYTTGTVSSASVTGPLSLRFEAPAFVAGGQPVPLRLVLTNIGKVTVVIGLPSESFFQTDLQVVQGSRIVWQKFRHRSCACSALEIQLSPNDSLVFRDLWPQRNNHHWQVGSGKYTVKGVLRESGVTQTSGGIEIPPVDIRVR